MTDNLDGTWTESRENLVNGLTVTKEITPPEEREETPSQILTRETREAKAKTRNERQDRIAKRDADRGAA